MVLFREYSHTKDHDQVVHVRFQEGAREGATHKMRGVCKQNPEWRTSEKAGLGCDTININAKMHMKGGITR